MVSSALLGDCHQFDLRYFYCGASTACSTYPMEMEPIGTLTEEPQTLDSRLLVYFVWRIFLQRFAELEASWGKVKGRP